MQSAFKAFEHEAWQNAVDQYEVSFNRLTEQAIPAILTVLDVKSNMSVLDVACGLGYLAASAQQLGAKATGVDFSALMVARAKKLHPSIDFQEGDAESLENYANNSFDAVAMNFGILHLDQPEKALKAIYRVLKPGGRIAFTTWSTPEKAVGFSIILNAIQTCGNQKVQLPPAPPFFYFSDPANCVDALTRCGYEEASTKTVHQLWELNSPDELFEAFLKGSARTGGILKMQTPDQLAAIRNNIRQAANPYLRKVKLILPMPAHLAWATKP